jgi:cysteinyl-tRNA synthetase
MKAGPDHIMRWNSPWSVGFPGWHLECSAMSRKYLGDEFDIHGGGNDLKFPHHENEIAQNEASCGHGGARYWLHTNMLLLNGKKMSKSDGNHITPAELFTGESEHVSKGYSPMAVRFFMLQAHYGSPLDMSDDALGAAEKGYQRLMEAVARLESIEPSGKTAGALENELKQALGDARAHLLDDFNTPRVIASLFEAVGLINAAADGHRQTSELTEAGFAEAKKHMEQLVHDVLGLKAASSEAGDDSSSRIEGLMKLIIDLRAQSRADKNWAMSDQIRDQLAALNIEVKDGKEGTTFSLK